MKKIISVLLCVVTLICSMSVCFSTVFASSNGTSGTLTWKLDDAGTLTISGSGKMSNYSVKSTSTVAPWMNGSTTNASIKKVVIDSGVTSVGAYTFANCTSLSTITIPSSVTEISEGAFFGCVGLSSMDLSDSISYIGASAFEGCTGITSFVIRGKVTTIDSKTFYNCKSLKTITIPKTVTTVCDSAFLGCSALTSVKYAGSETEKASIKISSNNTPLSSATWTYNTDISSQINTSSLVQLVLSFFKTFISLISTAAEYLVPLISSLISSKTTSK